MVDQVESTEKQADEPRIMCYVCKKMVPKSQTMEVEYAPGKKVWILSKYLRYSDHDKVAD